MESLMASLMRKREAVFDERLNNWYIELKSS
jgi:hypothetical protein